MGGEEEKETTEGAEGRGKVGVGRMELRMDLARRGAIMDGDGEVVV
jgi:hypothetical protein